MGHQSYVLLCTETTLSNPPVVIPKSSCDVHLLRSPCLSFLRKLRSWHQLYILQPWWKDDHCPIFFSGVLMLFFTISGLAWVSTHLLEEANNMAKQVAAIWNPTIFRSSFSATLGSLKEKIKAEKKFHTIADATVGGTGSGSGEFFKSIILCLCRKTKILAVGVDLEILIDHILSLFLNQWIYNYVFIKFRFLLLITYYVKSVVNILSIFVAFTENMNFTSFQWFELKKNIKIRGWRPRICQIFELTRTILSNSGPIKIDQKFSSSILCWFQTQKNCRVWIY